MKSVLNRFEGAKVKLEILEKKLTELKCNGNWTSSQELEGIEEAIKEVKLSPKGIINPLKIIELD